MDWEMNSEACGWSGMWDIRDVDVQGCERPVVRMYRIVGDQGCGAQRQACVGGAEGA